MSKAAHRPRLSTILVMASLVAALAAPAFAQVTPVTSDFREDWDLARVRIALARLAVRPETSCRRSAIQGGWETTEPDIATLHGGLLSPYDGVCFPNFHYVDVEHIVARKEADDSGMCNRTSAQREGFATDLLNLTFAPTSLNASKSDRDAGDLASGRGSLFRETLTAEGRCFWAAQTVRVKSKYGLSVDRRERDALAKILDTCATEETPTGRPQAPAGCGWLIRPQFIAAVERAGHALGGSCSQEPRSESWRAALQHADEITCTPRSSDAASTDLVPVPPITDPANPRASQIAAQEVCKAKLESITCGNIKRLCPSVGVIHRGEPLYQARGTNGFSNDSDDDGLYCESL